MTKRKGVRKRGHSQLARPNPQELQRSFQQAVVFFQQGRLNEADAVARRILKQLPDLPDMLHFRGLIACRSGDPGKGAKLIRQAVAGNPGNAEYLVNLGNACREMGRTDEAIEHYRSALNITPDIPELRNSLGILYREQGDLENAEAEFTQALRLRPSFAQAHYNLGDLYLQQDMQTRAIECYQETIRRDPHFVDAYIALIGIYREWNIPQRALPLFQEVLRHKSAEPSILILYGRTLQELDQTDEALRVTQKALELSPPGDETALMAMGHVLKTAGKHQEAEAHYRKVLEFNPYAASPYSALSDAHKFDGSEPEIESMERLLQRQQLSDDERIALHFSLGKAYDDCRRYDDAFPHYSLGNRLRGREPRYAEEEHKGFVNSLIEFFDSEFFSARRFPGVESDLPIFIVGMARSGTTLTESIIASHPQVFGAGELGDITRIKSHLESLSEGTQHYPACLLHLDDQLLRGVTQRFLDNLRDYDPEARHIVDKMPHNFLHLGLIAYLLPGTRVIHCQRNAVDNCLSIFFQNFQDEHQYKHDLAQLGRYYRQYERLMAHWRQVLPIPILDVRYEELVTDQEAVSRRLIDFCGLEWDDACLKFYRSRRSVQTASGWQVRQPIYQSSVDRWRRYEKHLGPLLEALGKEHV